MPASLPSAPPTTPPQLGSAHHEPPSFPGARWSLLLLLLINLFNYIDRFILAAIEPVIRQHFFPNDPENAQGKTGLLATAFLVSYLFAAPVFGWLADRTRRWLIVAAGVTLWSLASGASGLAHTFLALIITRVFVGLGEAAYGPTAPTIIADLYPLSRRARAMSWFYMAIPVGSALGYVIGSRVSASFGWQMAFYSVVAPGLLLGALALFRPDPPRGGQDESAPTKHKMRPRDYLTLLRTPSYVLTTAGYTALTFATGAISFWMPGYVTRVRMGYDVTTKFGQVKLADVSQTFGAILVVGGLLATIAGGQLADRLKNRYSGSYLLVSAAGALLAFPLFIAALYVPFPAAWVLIFFAIFFIFLHVGPVNTVPTNVTHPAVRASAYALLILVIHLLGDAISPPLIGYINDKTDDMNIGFLFVSGAILLAAVFWFWGARYVERDTHRAPTSLDSRPQ